MITKVELRRLGRYVMLAAYLAVLAFWSASAWANSVWLSDGVSARMIEVSETGRIVSDFVLQSDIGPLAPEVIIRGNHGGFWVNAGDQRLSDHFYHVAPTGQLLGAYRVPDHNAKITSIAIAHDGDVWVAAKRWTEMYPIFGEVRGDSNAISVYAPDGTLIHTMPMGHSKPLQIVNGTGRLMWIAATDGIYQATRNGQLRKLVSTSHPTIAASPDGDLWSIVDGSNLVEYNESGAKITEFHSRHLQHMKNLYVTANAIWAASLDQVYKFNQQGRLLALDELPIGQEAGMAQGTNGTIWLEGWLSPKTSWIMVLDHSGSVISQKNLQGVYALAISE